MMRWWIGHVRFPLGTGESAGDVFFPIRAETRKDAEIDTMQLAEDLVPSICNDNYTTWVTEAPEGYAPDDRNSWSSEPTRLVFV